MIGKRRSCGPRQREPADFEELRLLDWQDLRPLRIPVHRHAAARFRLRTAYLVLHFSDEALAGYRQPVADQGALIDLRVDHRRQTKLAGLAAVEEHVLGPDHQFHPLPGRKPCARRCWDMSAVAQGQFDRFGSARCTVPSSRFDSPIKVVTNKGRAFRRFRSAFPPGRRARCSSRRCGRTW
jgi:hypothetical protein